MEIVPMEKGHCPALARLEKLCFSHPWSRQALEEELENPCACFLTAMEGEEPLGYGGMHCVAGECFVTNVAVFPQRRRQGVGEAIVGALLEEARARGGEFLSLEVRPSNTGAVALYEKLGFRQEGRRRRFYTDPPEDALLLTRRFGKET